MFYAHVTWYCHDILQSTYGNHLVSCTGDPLAQTVKSDTCHAEGGMLEIAYSERIISGSI